MLNIFSCICYPSVCLGKCLFRSFSHFFIGLFGLLILSCLCILKINPLSVASFANIFSHSESCLFVLFMVSFAVQKLLSLIKAYLFIFASISFTLGDWSKKILLQFMWMTVLPVFSIKMKIWLSSSTEILKKSPTAFLLKPRLLTKAFMEWRRQVLFGRSMGWHLA